MKKISLRWESGERDAGRERRFLILIAGKLWVLDHVSGFPKLYASFLPVRKKSMIFQYKCNQIMRPGFNKNMSQMMAA